MIPISFNFRSDTICLLGDTHSYAVTHQIIKNYPNLDNEDVLFLGDGGEGFGAHQDDAHNLNKINLACKERNINFYCIRGNHCDPGIFYRKYCFSNLLLVPDYSKGQFPCGRAALLVGGGISVDRITRKVGVDYWPDEKTEYQKINRTYDFVFAHDAPAEFNHQTDSLWRSYSGFVTKDVRLLDDCARQRQTMSKIFADVHPKFAASGHYHNSRKEEKVIAGNLVKYRCLDIKEIDIFDAAAN